VLGVLTPDDLIGVHRRAAPADVLRDLGSDRFEALLGRALARSPRTDAVVRYPAPPDQRLVAGRLRALDGRGAPSAADPGGDRQRGSGCKEGADHEQPKPDPEHGVEFGADGEL
jgi:hypothetical protein